MNWNKDNLKRAADMRRAGKSGSEIARALGPDFTREAVNFKLGELGVRPNPRVAKKPAGQKKSAKPAAPSAAPGKRITIDNVKPHHCRWLLPDDKGQHFCGNNKYAVEGKTKPYCEFHYFMSIDPRRREEIKAPKSA